ncbi:tyrosine-protein phosphatase [Actinoallomurus spadix]|uniref:Tyrosine-protein phosphatase n=1 Tax=Actinoallomurus spadix TaxID=79912 RepID=A0ABP3G1P9_9ACTN|nr:tyrosine-protein phosphatase [Actinoallomurus spadix]MCO5990430.1 tyrosine-protein phosphatase [Actinoallomurus spadix]
MGRLEWDGAVNARDLGGLRTGDGRVTRSGALVRSGMLDRLTARGWSELMAYGIRTVIDLRDDGERTVLPPFPLTGVHVPLDDTADTAMWELIKSGDLDGTPLYYPIFLERKAERCVEAVRAVAHAAPGGVLVHCAGGRDRTGLVSMLLLLLAGVLPEEIVADYELSNRYMALNAPRYCTLNVLARHGTTEREAVLAVLDALDAAAYLRDAGLRDGEIQAVRSRLR